MLQKVTHCTGHVSAIPGLISCTGATWRWGLLSHAQNASGACTCSHTKIQIPVHIALIFMGEDLYKPFSNTLQESFDVNMCHMTSRCYISRVRVNSTQYLSCLVDLHRMISQETSSCGNYKSLLHYSNLQKSGKRI